MAAEIADRIGATLDVFVARKISAPGSPELGVGAVAEGGEPWLDERMLRRLKLRPELLADAVRAAAAELVERVQSYRGTRPLPVLSGADVVLVDDGLATGSTARAALVALRAARPFPPARLVLAVPVAPADAVDDFAGLCDDMVTLLTPTPFGAVSRWYSAFPQLTDPDVLRVLRLHHAGPGRHDT